MGALIIWLVVMVPVSALLTGLGIFAWRRQKPMWLSTFLAFSSMKLAGMVMLVGCILCVPVLPFVYTRIYKRYKKHA